MSSDNKYDLTYLKSISNDDQRFINDMVGDFISNTPDYFGKMKGALELKDYDTVYQVVHKFIPTLSFVGANEKLDEFEQFEQFAKNAEEGETLNRLFVELNNYCNRVCAELERDFDIK